MNGLLLSDFNAENLRAFLTNSSTPPNFAVEVGPFGQVISILRDPASNLWISGLDFLFVWTRPESILDSIRDVLSGLPANETRLLQEVDSFADAVLAARARSRFVFVVTWSLTALHSGHGLLDFAQTGVERLLIKANLRLLERLDSGGNIYFLNPTKWFQAAGTKTINPRLWYLGKIPFGPEVFKEAAREIKSSLRGLTGGSRKLIILDLDDTLWGGIVGDEGWEHLSLGGHDPVGEALVEFQRELKALSRRGMILAIVSKNDEAVAREAIEKHPEMVLRLTDFAGWKINWNDKAQNVCDLINELNLGADSAVFIDDNPVERARVREACPDVLVPDWPEDKRFYVQALLSLDCFNKPALSAEDRERTAMYVADRDRKELHAKVSSVEEWLHSLNLAVNVERLNSANLARATQLLNKTNQMNLATRRLSEVELWNWATSPHHQLWTVRVTDKLAIRALPVSLASR